MASYINTNIASLNAQRNLATSQSSLATALQRLSSGLRINSAKDDAAGLAISERMTSQINGSSQAARNANDGISLAQTAEGDLAQIGNNLQRMRDLSVQAANATNSSSDRAAINSEVQALSAEIDRVSQNSSFNGVKLLNGSFSAQSFQIGANNSANDTIQISAIASARTSALGNVGSVATLTSGATTAALSAGDLTLNGFQVGASTVGSAPGQSAASAFSIAAAINGISANSGVTATANANTVTGSGATAFTAIASNTFSINGISIGSVAAGSSAAGQGANVAAAINAVSAQSGVTATADASSGVLTLTAADGRDISLSLNGTATNATAAATNKTTLLAQTGLATGVVGTQASAATPTSTVASGAVSGGSVSGVTTTAATYNFTVDGNTVFSNTIAAGATGTLATGAQLDTAFATFLGTTAGAGYSIAGTFATGTAVITKANGTAITIGSVTAGGTGGTVTPVAFAGAGFVGTTAAAGPAVAATAVANHGTISLNSTNSNGIVWAGNAAASVGLGASGTQAATVASIASLNVLTAANATSALASIDSALATINSSRASLGAYQNRFASVVTSLQTTSENLSAARSRIQDTDFAAETANLTRGQILQQAGTAMLAQANALPNGVLALLR